MPLQQLQRAPVPLVGWQHVAVDDPIGIARYVRHPVEVRGAELHAEQVLALSRSGGRLEVELPHQRKRAVHHLEPLLGRRDAGVVMLGRLFGWRHRIG